MLYENRRNILLNHYNSRLPSRVNSEPTFIRQTLPRDHDATFVSESQRSDWIFSSSLGDSSTASFNRMNMQTQDVTQPSTMTLREIPTAGKTSTNPIIRFFAKLRMTKCTAFICTLITGMLCLGIPLTAVLTAWSATGFTGKTNAETSTTGLAIVTSSTTGTTTTQTTTSCAMTASGRGLTLTLSGAAPSTWTQYRFNYTATATRHILIFGFQTENNRQYYLDSVSVIDRSVPSVEILRNPGFENSTGTPVGWVQWCTSSCGGRPGTVTTNSSCFSTTGNCFVDNCHASSGIDFVAQSFSTIVGRMYNISFWLLAGGSGTSTSNRFYFDIAS